MLPRIEDETFQPLKRFEHWTGKQHARFEWLAGEQLVRLGYAPNAEATLVSDLINRARDACRPHPSLRKRAQKEASSS